MDVSGWNNGVKLLNDACQALYGNSSKSITATNLSYNKLKDFMTDVAISKFNGTATGKNKDQKQGMVSTLGDTTKYNRCPDMLWNCYGSVRSGKATGGTLQPWEQDSFLDAGNDYGRSEENFRAIIHGFKPEWVYTDDFNKNPKNAIGLTSAEYKTSDSGINYFKILFNNGAFSQSHGFWLSEREIYGVNMDTVTLGFGIMGFEGFGSNNDGYKKGISSSCMMYNVKTSPADNYIKGGSFGGTLYPVVTVPISQLTGSSSLSVK